MPHLTGNPLSYGCRYGCTTFDSQGHVTLHLALGPSQTLSDRPPSKPCRAPHLGGAFASRVLVERRSAGLSRCNPAVSYAVRPRPEAGPRNFRIPLPYARDSDRDCNTA